MNNLTKLFVCFSTKVPICSSNNFIAKIAKVEQGIQFIQFMWWNKFCDRPRYLQNQFWFGKFWVLIYGKRGTKENSFTSSSSKLLVVKSEQGWMYILMICSSIVSVASWILGGFWVFEGKNCIQIQWHPKVKSLH